MRRIRLHGCIYIYSIYLLSNQMYSWSYIKSIGVSEANNLAILKIHRSVCACVCARFLYTIDCKGSGDFKFDSRNFRLLWTSIFNFSTCISFNCIKQV